MLGFHVERDTVRTIRHVRLSLNLTRYHQFSMIYLLDYLTVDINNCDLRQTLLGDTNFNSNEGSRFNVAHV